MKTFIVRLFVSVEPKPGAHGAGLHGLVEEVGSGRRASFSSDQELLAFLVAAKAEHKADVSGRSLS